MRIATPQSIARTAADLLGQIAAYVSPEQQDAAYNAVAIAVQQLIAGVAFTRDGAAIRFPSRSRNGQIVHTTTRFTCSCEAFAARRPCWHRAAWQIITSTAAASPLPPDPPETIKPPPIHCRHCHAPMREESLATGERAVTCQHCGHAEYGGYFAWPAGQPAAVQHAQA